MEKLARIKEARFKALKKEKEMKIKAAAVKKAKDDARNKIIAKAIAQKLIDSLKVTEEKAKPIIPTRRPRTQKKSKDGVAETKIPEKPREPTKEELAEKKLKEAENAELEEAGKIEIT